MIRTMFRLLENSTLPQPRIGFVRTILLCGLGWLCASASPGCLAAAPGKGVDFFETRIRPVLAEHCYKCHSANLPKPKGGVRLDTVDAIRSGGNSGPMIEPGKPDESLLIQAVGYSGEVAKMPPKGKLSDKVIEDFRQWIQLGAPMPSAEHPAVKSRVESASASGKSQNPTDWWSLRPVVKPAVPRLDPVDSSHARGPIDAFVLARLRSKGLTMAPEADRRTLVRRLYFDLVGLPPTPEEIARFLADTSPTAYQHLVDRLLESPQFGERWARFWMDLVHFAETHGHDQDRIRPNAWPYRDYLIDSFNRDVPYARFVQEQIAADLLFPNEPKLTVALGMLAAGPWDESSLRDIRDDSIDRQIGYYLDRDDMVATVISTFDSATVHCARCHDHKFDPISQKDYYALQAVFAGVDKAERSYDADPGIGRLRKDLEAKRNSLKLGDSSALEWLRSHEVASTVAHWETETRTAPVSWTPVVPTKVESKGGCTLTVASDQSIRSTGTKPAKDTYTIRTKIAGGKLTGIRLEVLPDKELPAQGPGRNDNGNLHLTEFEATIEPNSDPKSSRTLSFRRVAADFDQSGWEISAAIDGDNQTAWGIFPEVGKPHEAVFELTTPAEMASGDSLVIKMIQTNPPGHLIGRFRLSATTQPLSVSSFPVKSEIRSILAVAADKRTDAQKLALSSHVMVQEIANRIAALPPKRFVYAAASDFAPDAGHKPPGGPRPVFVLRRGDIHQPIGPAEPGTLSSIAALPTRFPVADPKSEGMRRADLARWISDSKNPLTWRSIVNRVWQSHFGRGLVDTPNDFGRMGALPTHPELLDWLAAELVENGGSLKRLHREIVTSMTYRQATIHDSRAESIDADNRLLWRQNRRRLDAESIRDAILQTSGAIDLSMKGPSVQQFRLSPGVHVTPVVDYTAYDWSAPDAGRRSVYRFLFRTLPDPFMDALDGADSSQLVAVRSESITPLQALALLNNPFVLKYGQVFADRIERAGGDLQAKTRLAHEMALGREPAPDELKEWTEYAAKFGLANFARILFNSNEFLFVN